MSGHGPGPWKIQEEMLHDFRGFNVLDYDDSPVAKTSEYPYYCIETEANARLIAAAPDLLEAAKNIEWLASEVEMYHRRPEIARAIEQAVAAVKKAEGK